MTSSAEAVLQRFQTWIVVACLAASQGCTSQEHSDRVLSARARDRSSQPFVLFAAPRMTISRLETPAPAPIAPGSQASSTTLSSDNPAVVSVARDGQLVAHAPGAAAIRGSRGQVLVVDVVVGEHFAIQPEEMVLAAGQTGRIRPLVDGVELDGAAVKWAMYSPGTVLVLDGTIHAMSAGDAIVAAQWNGHAARCLVHVQGPDLKDATLSPAAPVVRAGASISFQLLAGGNLAGRTAVWSSSNERVVSHVTAGVFRAAVPGKATVCAESGRTKICTLVRVEP